MSRLACLRDRSRASGVLMPFVVIGDPDFETSGQIVDVLIRAEADILEFGMAFSDPPADGPVIQAADQRALRAGATVARAFEFLARVRERTERPIALLVYYNIILSQGVDTFYQRARASGVDAVLVADLPIEEAGPAITAARAHEIAPVFIVSELSTDARLDAISSVAEGYLYLVARLGVTGASASVGDGLADVIARIRQRTKLPILAGFGISTPEHVRAVLRAGADGAICGSALVKHIEAHLDDPNALLREVEHFCQELKAATR